MTRWLIIDGDNLCWRQHHTVGALEFNGSRTGILFGVLRSLIVLCRQFRPDHVAWCFDLGPSKRKLLYPAYKANRHKETSSPDSTKEYVNVRRQIEALRTKYLPELGFMNVFSQSGYEADDLMASVVLSLLPGHEATLVSSDKDVLQMLSPGIDVWNFKTVITSLSFNDEWDITPIEWVRVKALAGCPGDNIRGVPRVGEKTAVAYLRGEKIRAGAQANIDASKDLIEFNRRLVRLPFPGTRLVQLAKDKAPKPKAWDELCRRLGITSLVGECPFQGFQAKPKRG